MEGGNEGIIISTGDQRDCDLHEDKNYGIKRVWSYVVKKALFAYIWFSGVKKFEEARYKGIYYYGPVKTFHKEFFLDTLEKPTKEWTGGYHIVINIKPKVPIDRPLTTIGYK